MAVEGCLMIVETILYLATFVSSLIAGITVGLSRSSFDNDCLLFAEVMWCNATDFGFTETGSNGVCGFSIGLEIITGFYALLVGGYYICILFQWVQERRGLLLPTIIINVVCLVILFIDSCILSIGFNRFCGTITGGEAQGSKIKECSADLSTKNWNRPPHCDASKKPNHDTYTGGNFFGFLTTAQGASWFAVLFWLIIGISVIVRRIRDRPVLDPTTSDKAPIVSNLTI